ncbi:hypothetical protein [Kriegella aquimaris]|uniref:Neutral/alkaline non-lysosomal ceramidase, N-terminal n=1 Tax=Kriegella aquimaris TaxID=192904 RepID=A0A1G9IZQ9_9FLAO|nr:hypothetical protein [Kriegella aquimaris]SDL30748.1 hypothetical protein SAMN04488514_101345 [Kriegella aquimaris]
MRIAFNPFSGAVKKSVIFSGLFFFIFFINGHAQQLMVGAAKRIITPEPLLAVSGGVGTPQPVQEKKGDLFVRAMVLVKGNEKIAIVNIDNLGWPAALGNRSRALIKGVAPENILIGATHTHSAPDAYAFPNEQGGHGADLGYLDKCVVLVAEAVNEAFGKVVPANLKIAVAKAEGKIAYNYYAPKLYDSRCGVIQAVNDTGKPIVTLVNYAIHPEVLGNDKGILSGDLVTPLYDRIEQKTGGMAVFMNGAQGGMVTADNRLDGGEEARNWEECQRIGNLLGDEALRIISDAPIQKNPDIYCSANTVSFPIESAMLKYILQNSPLGIGQGDSDSISTTLNLLNIGSAQVLTIPGEALPNIGYYLKRKMPTEHAFLFGLTNDAFGYILTKEDFNSFDTYQYISRTSLGESTGEILISELLEMVERNPKPKK